VKKMQWNTGTFGHTLGFIAHDRRISAPALGDFVMRKILAATTALMLLSGMAMAQNAGSAGGGAGGATGGGNGVKPPQGTATSGALNNPTSASRSKSVIAPKTTGTGAGVVTNGSAGAPKTKGSDATSGSTTK